MEKIILNEAFDRIDEHWSPRLARLLVQTLSAETCKNSTVRLNVLSLQRREAHG